MKYSNSNLLKSRVDNLSTLSEGSTTGDAELIDIRTGNNGTIYESAGNAVREQFNKIETQQNNAFNNISVTWKNGKSLNHETEVVQANRCISEYINLSGRTLNVIIPDDNTVKYSILFFDEDHQYVSEISYFTVSGSFDGWYSGRYCKYCRIRTGFTDDSVPTMYSSLTDTIILKWSDSDVMQHRGNIIALGYTAFSQCAQN